MILSKVEKQNTMNSIKQLSAKRTGSKCRLLSALVATCLCPLTLAAQDSRPSSSLFLQPQKKAHVTLTFNIDGEGKRFEPTWGLDQAWINDQNTRKGINHMGKENIGIARSAFSYTKELTNDSVIAANDLTVLRKRNTNINLIDKNLPIVLTADQGAFDPDKGEVPPEYFVKNKAANVDHWAAMINSHVHWLQQNTKHPVVGVSPFNEPDYWSTEEGATVANHAQVARILKERYPRMADVAMVGGNTLNDDKAWNWFSEGLDIYEWGNTHQLAGSFNNYASFYQQLAANGKVGYNDEMHNVAEAMVGLEYGMTVGIWWGFDSRTRGEFCDISRHGERLSYAEHRNNWTAASVYRHDDGRVKAFIGSSERQAATTTYQFLSRDREVYFDGQGPLRDFTKEIPGGTDYTIGQTNAECVIDITWGADVPPYPVTEGVYKLVNKATGNVMAAAGENITQQIDKGTERQQWTVKPVSPRIGGDYSFYEFASVSNPMLRPNVENFSTINNANVIAYSLNETPSSNEQWYLQYAGDGYYFIRSRETALYLSSASDKKTNGINVRTNELLADDKQALQLWRLLPVDIAYETTAPEKPSGLIAEARPASVKLSWTANSEDDLAGYIVLRAPQGTDEWNTIARQLTGTTFVDNTCQPSRAYIYKVKAIDQAQNQSEASEAVEAAPTGERTMIGQWLMDNSLLDATPNHMDAALYGTASYSDGHPAEGEKTAEATNRSINLNQTQYVQLPYEVASSDELTVAMWVYWRAANLWQRLFDFGNGTDQYLFLTPSNGTVMRFAIKNGGSEQTVDCTKLTQNKWKHVAVTIGKDKTTIYVDGVEAASSTGITIRPSDIRPALNYLGRSQFYSDPFLKAYLDDVRIYNYALTAEEVQEAMAGAANGVEALTTDPAPVPAEVYSLDGRRLSAPQRGINIVNGQKVVTP